MLPKVSQTEDVEMIRDGGSLAATFSEASGNRHILFFEIASEQYLPPVLIDRDPSKRPADTETVIYGDLCGPVTALTWDEARQMAVADRERGP